MFWLLEKRLVAGGMAALSLLSDLALLGLLGMVGLLDLLCIVEHHYHHHYPWYDLRGLVGWVLHQPHHHYCDNWSKPQPPWQAASFEVEKSKRRLLPTLLFSQLSQFSSIPVIPFFWCPGEIFTIKERKPNFFNIYVFPSSVPFPWLRFAWSISSAATASTSGELSISKYSLSKWNIVHSQVMVRL